MQVAGKQSLTKNTVLAKTKSVFRSKGTSVKGRIGQDMGGPGYPIC